jgi:transcription-repair coupling factor (superfamily II helicase)
MPIEIGLLSRFKSAKETKLLLDQLAKGKIDIVIGTHRLIQKDVEVKNLGLIIIDEEHRFGVRQKERLKQLRSEVDILTLTATPIPRTLNMTMAGLREISIIATPPAQRLAIKTFVMDYNEAIIREACLREIHRGGQMYYLHNEVKTIQRVSEELQALIPEAKVAFAHGQMSELQLEQVMRDFYHQHINLLVSTTIIESGIDIPSANTMVINRADKFGLAQLHQLRGRVGRSHHQAFAYLLVPELKYVTKDARKRLDAIAQLEELGAGFSLASHDLEIRGAGELLGETQSGLIDDVGFTLYSDYLNRAIESLKVKEDDEGKPAAAARGDTEIHFGFPALFPDEYLPDVHLRLVMYKRIASAQNKHDLKEIEIESIDRFGLLPDSAKYLFRLSALKLKAQPLGIQKIDVDEDGGIFNFIENPPVDISDIIAIIQSDPQTYKLSRANELEFTLDLETAEQRFSFIGELLDKLSANQL